MSTIKEPKIIGLTGGIATGKSTVSAMFRALGAKIIDADVAARRVVEPESPGLQAIASAFGNRVIQPDGSLNRRELGNIIFNDPMARRKLDAITHPRIVRLMKMQLETALSSKSYPVIILDVPLLFETRLFADDIQESVLVYTSSDIQLQRLMQRDGLTMEDAQQRINSQMPIDEKRLLARRIIDNSGSETNTEEQVVVLWKEWINDEDCAHRT